MEGDVITVHARCSVWCTSGNHRAKWSLRQIQFSPKPGESTVFEGGRETIVAERLSDWRLPDLGRHRFGALGCRLGRGWDPSRCASQVCCLREGFVAASGFWTAFPKVCRWLLGRSKHQGLNLNMVRRCQICQWYPRTIRNIPFKNPRP